ncbi:MAG: hypothetical protein QOJ20_5075 [Mycobacterium sp.]|jgi:hypothetical protein|nr:hypothetical protein [Mycobacterium sp.]MDT5283880.1 hypothetical protein [Mycobacterium sp.]
MVVGPMFRGVTTNAMPTPGLRVHVSDASPRGFSGRVTAVHPDALTVARDDNGVWELVILSRRRVIAAER